MKYLPKTIAGLALVILLGANICNPADGSPDGPTNKIPPLNPVSPVAHLEDERNTIEVFNALTPSVVYVTQTQTVRDFFMRAMEVPAGTGTGFIWDEHGHIVTNYHVVFAGRGTPKISVTLQNQKTYPARVVGAEPRKDIAVLRIDAPPEELVPILQPEAGYQLVVGQKALAIGNPFGLDHTLTTGVVSALGREVMGVGGVTIRDMVQTDAAINPGNSGGPLLDSAGHLIGMNTIIYSQSGSSAGIGFAVPAKTIQRVVPQIIHTGKAEQLGIGVTLLADALTWRSGIEGVVIEGVVPDSPAAKAGLKGLQQTSQGIIVGDIIVGVDGEKIQGFDDLYNALDAHRAGDKVIITIRRENQNLDFPMELIVLP
jgi:S1-C subfamily serine protease